MPSKKQAPAGSKSKSPKPSGGSSAESTAGVAVQKQNPVGAGTVAQAAASTGSKLPLIGEIAAIVIIVGIVYLVYFPQSSTGVQSGSLPRTGGTVPQQLANLPVNNSQAATLALSILTRTYALNATNITIRYSGTISGKPAGAAGVLASFTSPLLLTLNKDGDDKTLSMNITSIPVLGSAELIYKNFSGATSICTNLNTTAISSGDISNMVTKGGTLICTNSSQILGVNMEGVSRFDLGVFEQLGISLNYGTPYASQYGGAPCTDVFGTLYQAGQYGSQGGSGAFEMCLDNSYLPLFISAGFNSQQGTFDLTLNNTSISG